MDSRGNLFTGDTSLNRITNWLKSRAAYAYIGW
jgi:hypothetical protein